jgi:hypothetical protein
MDVDFEAQLARHPNGVIRASVVHQNVFVPAIREFSHCGAKGFLRVIGG